MPSAGRFVVFLVCGLAGCSDSDRGRLSVHPVEGKLLAAGIPAGNARIAFHPSAGPIAVGVTDREGTFRLTTYTTGDGAPAGEYVVTVLWPDDTLPADECEIVDPSAHDRLRGRYIDPAKSDLRAVVRPGRNALTLSVTVGERGWNLPRQSGPGPRPPLSQKP